MTAQCGFGIPKQGAAFTCFEGHEECVVNAVWTPDHRSILSCDSSGGLREWAMNG